MTTREWGFLVPARERVWSLVEEATSEQLASRFFRPLLEFSTRVTHHGLRRLGFESRTARTRVGRVFFLDAAGDGDLPPLVLLHGLALDSASYVAMLPRLRRRFRRVIAPDLAGHGQSDHPEGLLDLATMTSALSELLEQTVSEPSVLFGGSLGGWVALHLGLARPSAVRALVLSSPAGAAGPKEEIDELRRILQALTFRDALDAVSRSMNVPVWLRPFIATAMRVALARKGLRDMIMQGRAEELLGPEQLARLSMPILLLWGKKERLLPSSHLEFFRRHLPPHAVIEEPELMGHCAYLDCAAVCAMRIIRFVEEELQRSARAGIACPSRFLER